MSSPGVSGASSERWFWEIESVFCDLFHRDVHALGDLGRRRLAAQLLQQRRRALADAVQRAGPVERHPHDAALLGERLENRLADPPHRVGDELDALGLVELVGGADEAEVALVDQIGERDALVLVFLGDRDDEAEVAADQLVERLAVADADPLGEADFFLLRNQRVLADLAEVLVERSLVERGTALAGTDLHWTHRLTPRTGHSAERTLSRTLLRTALSAQRQRRGRSHDVSSRSCRSGRAAACRSSRRSTTLVSE